MPVKDSGLGLRADRMLNAKAVLEAKTATNGLSTTVAQNKKEEPQTEAGGRTGARKPRAV